MHAPDDANLLQLILSTPQSVNTETAGRKVAFWVPCMDKHSPIQGFCGVYFHHSLFRQRDLLTVLSQLAEKQ